MRVDHCSCPSTHSSEKQTHTCAHVYHTLCHRFFQNPNRYRSIQVDITVEFQPVDGASGYELQWKQHPENWEQHGQSQLVKPGSTKITAAGLEPGATYCLRMVCISDGERGTPGKELIVDTEQVGCTPTADDGCACVLL